ncbi:MAG: hypothetical protein RI936_26 [Pseudomonadota bacterium]|jgi:hypothetical protein
MSGTVTKLSPRLLASPVTARCPWGNTYTLERRADGMFHGTCRAPVDGLVMRFAVAESTARAWANNHRTAQGDRA